MARVLDARLIQKLSRIQLLLLDVDGVLTDCRVFLDSSGEWKRFFSIRDGYGIMRIKEAGYQVGILTGSKARDIQERAKALKLDHFVEGTLDKLPAFEMLLKSTGLKAEEVAYMGDDAFDLPVLQMAGFAATVSDAMEEVLESCEYVAARPAGNGAVREVCELILRYGAFAKGRA